MSTLETTNPVPSLGRPREVGAGVAEPARALRLERRSWIRRDVPGGGVERLWLACGDGAMGGQVNVRDFSTRGLGIIVNRAAVRLVEALLAAKVTGTPVEASRAPGDREGRKARIVWDSRTEAGEIRFGLEFGEPLRGWFGMVG